MRFFVLLMLALTVMLTGCESEKMISQETRTFEVTAVKRPKNFRVSLKDVENGRTYDRVRVGKRCSRWREVKVGSRVQLTEATYLSESGKRRIALVNKRKLCPGR